MSFFNYLFGSKLSIESLAKLKNDDEIKLKLQKSKVKDLQKLCLTKCQDLDTEDKQKDVYINAILDVIHKVKSPMYGAPALPAAVSKEFESHPVDLDHPPAPVEAEPLRGPELKPTSGGKNRKSSKGGRKRGRKMTHRRKT